MKLIASALVWLALVVSANAQAPGTVTTPNYTFVPTLCVPPAVPSVMTIEGKAVGGCYTATTSGGGGGTPPVPATAFIMAPVGSDLNAGSVDAPVATREACQALMQAPGAAFKTCQIRGGEYVGSKTFILGPGDAGETWTAYPGEQPHFTVAAGVKADWQLKTGADGITISGISATGAQAKAGGACGVNDWLRVGSSDHVANLAISGNKVDTFGCALSVFYVTGYTVTDNWFHDIGYVGVSCNACNNGTVARNIVWNLGLDPNNTSYGNAYPYSFSQGSSPPYITTNFIVESNIAVNNKLWQCYDAHGGADITWRNNLCVGAGGNTAMNNAGMDQNHPIRNITVTGNILDKGSLPNGRYDIVMCAAGDCSTNNPIVVGGLIENNYQLGGASVSCQIYRNPQVTVNNPSSPYCKNDPETVVGVSFKPQAFTDGATTKGGPAANFTANQPNAVVAELAVAVFPTIWPFPTPPGQLSISGTNSGGFVICQYNKVCQPAAGTPTGTYTDFAVTAAMDGMAGGPYTATAGTLQLVGR